MQSVGLPLHLPTLGYWIVADNNLITASSTGALLWAKQIIEHLGVFQSNTLESWYEYFSTGQPKHFFALMQTLPSRNEN